MKTMKLFMIGCLVIGSITFVGAQTKTSSTKSTVSTTVSKPIAPKAAVKNVLPQVEIAKQIAQGQTAFAFLGTYNIHAGVQKTIIGQCKLLDDGSYTITVNSDADSHGIGNYAYDAVAKKLIWKGGLFLSNKYNGVLQLAKNGKLHILLSGSTFAEKID